MGPNVEIETENGDIRGNIAAIPLLFLMLPGSHITMH